MSINLTKGQRISLEKVAPGLEAGLIGLGWDVNQADMGAEFDLDASAFLLGGDEKLVSDEHLVFYNNPKSPDPENAIEYMGDNRTGAGEGDDEVILVNLPKVPSDIEKIAITVSIYEAHKRKQNFGQVDNAYVRLVDIQTKKEVLRYDLTEEYSVETGLIVAELYRSNREWRVNAVGAGFKDGLPAILEKYTM